MLNLAGGQTRNKVSSARIPPWRKWVRGRERVPAATFDRNLNVAKYASAIGENVQKFDLIAGMQTNIRLLGDSESSSQSSVMELNSLVNKATVAVPSVRKFLVPFSPLRKRGLRELNAIAASITESLPLLSVDEKLRLLCAFGQLQEYSVTTARIGDRYNTKGLLYENGDFYSQLVGSVDWSQAYSGSALNTAKDVSNGSQHKVASLAPFLQVLRSLNRISGGGTSPDLGRQVRDAVEALVRDVYGHTVGVMLKPAHAVEILMILGKQRIFFSDFFEYIGREVELGFGREYSLDLVGDIARTFRTMNYVSADLDKALLREIPLCGSELAWWNLVDIADYVSIGGHSASLLPLLFNEIWKLVPDMRSGYAAKALRVVANSDGTLCDSRTKRALIRAIPKSLGKMHPNEVAQAIIAAARIGYDPRKRYGKKHGSLLYRRLERRLVVGPERAKKEGKKNSEFLTKAGDPSTTCLSLLSSTLVVSMAESLHAMGRPLRELMDVVLEDVCAKKFRKYSTAQLLRLRRVFGDRQGVELLDGVVREGDLRSLSVEDRVYLAGVWQDINMIYTEYEKYHSVPISDLVLLLKSPMERISQWAFDLVTTSWLEANLFKISEIELVVLCETLAVVDAKNIDQNVVALIALRVNALAVTTALSTEQSCTLIASLLVLARFNFSAIDRTLFARITGKPLLSLEAVQLCQLICAHLRMTGVKETNTTALFKFCGWIEDHLVSKNGLVSAGDTTSGAARSHGYIASLNVWPVELPHCLPDPRIDLVSLHQCRSATAVKRVLKPFGGDAGVVRFDIPVPATLITLLRDSYLRKLGWVVERGA